MKIDHLVALTAFCTSVSLVPDTAHAYLDPGTGSMILQAALASIFAGMFAVKVYWNQLVTFFSRKSPQTDPSIADTSEDGPAA